MSRQNEKYVFATDIGTSSTKSVLVSIRGEIVDVESKKIGLFFLQMVEPSSIRHDCHTADLERRRGTAGILYRSTVQGVR